MSIWVKIFEKIFICSKVSKNFDFSQIFENFDFGQISKNFDFGQNLRKSFDVFENFETIRVGVKVQKNFGEYGKFRFGSLFLE